MGALILSCSLFGCVSQPNRPETGSAPEDGGAGQDDSYDFRRETLFEENRNHMRLTAEEQSLGDVLTTLKAEARAYAGTGSPYGVHDWATPEVGQLGLHRFLEAMPKGADLHAHDLSFVSADILINTLVSHDGVLVGLTDTPDGVRATFYPGASLAPEGAVPLGAALAEGIIDRASLIDLLTINGSLPHEQAVRELQSIEEGLAGLWSDPVVVTELATQGLLDYARSGIRLVELRLTLTPDDSTNLSRLAAIRDAYHQVRATEPDFRLRVIACADTTGSSPDDTIETLRSAIRLSGQVFDETDPSHPTPLIIGLDLIGDEDARDPLSEYADFLCSDEVAASGLGLFLSCGETLSTDNVAVVDAYLMGATRVGSALSLRRFPALLESYRQDGIAIETYPVSSWRLGLTSDLRLHPAESYLRRQCPVVLCTDYAGLMEPCPLTDDYVAATLAWDLTVADLKQLALNSLERSGLSPDDTNQLKARWEADWEAFVASELARSIS
jgi:adenosine deaminase